MQYAIQQGVLYPDTSAFHSDVISEVKSIASKIQLEEVVRAFLYSLSTGKNEYRTALASFLYAKALPNHNATIQDEFQSRNRCVICGLKLMNEQAECEIKKSNYSAYRYFPDRIQDICRPDYVLFDLQQFQLLPKVNFGDEDIRILNRIFGLVEELTSSNKIIALQKLITTEKVLPANKNEIYVVLGVLAACGVFDTPDHKGYASGFVNDVDKDFVYEYDLFYPLNYWRGKHGINYDAVENIFGALTGNRLDKQHAIQQEVQRNVAGAKKKVSKAEQYFVEGEYNITLTNEQRYYYGLSPILPEWEKETRYSVTYQCYKRSEIYFSGNTIKKMIYEEKCPREGGEIKGSSYLEFDLDAETEDKILLFPKTSRGKKKPWTPTLLMTPTYMHEQLHVNICAREECVISFNSQNDQMLPLPLGKVEVPEDFQRYTEEYIQSLPENYNQVLANFRDKKRVTVKYKPGDIFRVSLSPTTYTYCLILGIGREMLKWDQIPPEHPIHPMMARPIMFRQYKIITENPEMTVEELEHVPMFPVELAQDNEVLWETYPIVGNKMLTEEDVEFGVAYNKKTGVGFWGFSPFRANPENYGDLYEGSISFWLKYGFSTWLSIPIHVDLEEEDKKRMELCKRIQKELGMPDDCSQDDFSKRFGGPTRADYLNWIRKHY